MDEGVVRKLEEQLFTSTDAGTRLHAIKSLTSFAQTFFTSHQRGPLRLAVDIVSFAVENHPDEAVRLAVITDLMPFAVVAQPQAEISGCRSALLEAATNRLVNGSSREGGAMVIVLKNYYAYLTQPADQQQADTANTQLHQNIYRKLEGFKDLEGFGNKTHNDADLVIKLAEAAKLAKREMNCGF